MALLFEGITREGVSVPGYRRSHEKGSLAAWGKESVLQLKFQQFRLNDHSAIAIPAFVQEVEILVLIFRDPEFLGLAHLSHNWL